MTPQQTHLQQRLDTAFTQWSLLQSKFYQAWSAGTLPVEALAQYSAEYGAYISLIGDGWAAHGDNHIAEEEREHAQLWRTFAKALGTDIGGVQTPAVRALVARTKEFFSEQATSIGALYAFELQQPATAQSKLEGLKAHYPSVPASAHTYFEIHCHDDEEPALLRERLSALSSQDQERAVAACEETCKLLREALDGIYEAHCSECVM